MVVESEKTEEPIIVIMMPFLGQGQVINEEWIDARRILYEIVTKPSVLPQLSNRIQLCLFIGEKPHPMVSEYVEKHLAGIQNVSVVQKILNPRTRNQAIEMVAGNSEYVVSCIIAEDDGWPLTHLERVLQVANELIAEGRTHVGIYFRDGLEWQICDTVDIPFKEKRNRIAVWKKIFLPLRRNMSHSIFILQPRDELFVHGGGGHPKVSLHLKNQGFEIHNIEDSNPAWLYVRHPLADTSGINSHNHPIENFQVILKEMFGIEESQIEERLKTENGFAYCEKRTHKNRGDDGINHLQTYYVGDVSDEPFIPGKNLFADEKGEFWIRPRVDFNLKERCRLKIFDIGKGEYILIREIVDVEEEILLGDEISDETEYKFAFEYHIDGRWQPVIPFIGLKR